MSLTQSKLGITVSNPTGNVYYGSFYDLTDQNVTSGSIAAMKFASTDFASGVSITNDGGAKPTQITIANAGIYNIQFSAQFYRSSGGSTAQVVIWLRKNGSDLPSTSTIVHFANNTVYHVAAWNFFVDANPGDDYQIMWTQDDAVVMSHEAANLILPYPEVPSVILTVNKVA
jgi:hypothetical protein